MTESMNQLIPIFEDIIKANNFITFAYSSLDDRWFYLSMKAGDDYDSTKILGNLNQAYAYMLEECQYYWLKRNSPTLPSMLSLLHSLRKFMVFWTHSWSHM